MMPSPQTVEFAENAALDTTTTATMDVTDYLGPYAVAPALTLSGEHSVLASSHSASSRYSAEVRAFFSAAISFGGTSRLCADVATVCFLTPAPLDWIILTAIIPRARGN